MINFIDFSEDKPKETYKRYESLCIADGCPCTVFCGQLTQGIQSCEFHERVNPKYWPYVTEQVKKYQPLITLAERLLRDWRLIDDYYSLNHSKCPELAPIRDIPCIQIEGKQSLRDESAYDYGNRIKLYVRNKIISPDMIENSEESKREKSLEEISPLSAYLEKLKLSIPEPLEKSNDFPHTTIKNRNPCF